MNIKPFKLEAYNANMRIVDNLIHLDRKELSDLIRKGIIDFMEPVGIAPREIVSRQELIFRGHKIELQTEAGAVPFSPEHIARITPILEFYWDIDPELVRKWDYFKSAGFTEYDTWKGGFPKCGANEKNDTKNGVVFTKRGMSLVLPHRVSSGLTQVDKGFVSSFSGTTAHEMAHGGVGNGLGVKLLPSENGNMEFYLDWVKKFGWKKIDAIDNSYKTRSPELYTDKAYLEIVGKPVVAWRIDIKADEGWSKNKEGFWQKGSYFITHDEYTIFPEKCIGGVNSYASSTYSKEDICDSMAAFILNPDILDPDKKDFIKQKINLTF